MTRLLVLFLLPLWFLSCSRSDTTTSDTHSLIGPDHRREIVTKGYPYSAIGMLFADDENCTASLVWRNILLTAKHCVIGPTGGYRNLGFISNFVDNTIRLRVGLPTRRGDGVAHAATVASVGQVDDWALLLLDDSIGDRTNWLDVLSDDLSGRSYTLAGYSLDRFARLGTGSVDEACHVTALGKELQHDCASTQGASGSPIFTRKENAFGSSALVVGVHAAGSTTFNLAVPSAAFKTALADLIAKQEVKIGSRKPDLRVFQDPEDRNADSVAPFWKTLSANGAPSSRALHSAVVFEDKMVIWGGQSSKTDFKNDGAQYDPESDSWSALPTAGAPSGRYSHTAVVINKKMLVWGGKDTALKQDGGIFDFVANTWSPLPTSGAPSGRFGHSAVVIGRKMLVWGGIDGKFRNDGGIFDLDSGLWTALPTQGAPAARRDHAAYVLGTKMIIWGGVLADGYYCNDGGVFDLATNSWDLVPTIGGGGNSLNVGGLMGDKLVQLGENSDKGGVYDVPTRSWHSISMTNAPLPYAENTVLIVHDKMFIFGLSSTVPAKGIYNLTTNAWSPLDPTGMAPSMRQQHSVVTIDNKMLIWGGRANSVKDDGAVLEVP